MGEVYRATDTRLNRTVAIKILPPHLSDDANLRQRFEREAKAISSLSHPHICVLHDVGHQDGTDFLVMEFLEGETLAQRLTKGALPLDQVLKLGLQIADALDTAHRRGIVHRDLKPGNIMVTPSGAKLLDFGLAKATVPLLGEAAMTAAATQTTPVTQQGAIVGTFQYMSPEQVEGKEVDARSDIFSFGSVLYEMVTGDRAFPGRNPISVGAAILEKEPESMRTLRPLTPPGLDHAIRACLAKNPDDRWQTVRDLLLQLKWLAEPGSPSGVAALAGSHDTRSNRLAWLAASALAVVAIVASVAWWRAPRFAPTSLLMQLSAELPAGATIDRFRGASLALSPDGTRIVVSESDPAGNPRLVARRLNESEFVPVFGADSAFAPVFSPDGQWLAFFAEGKLKKLPAQGGVPVTLCDVAGFAGGASWGDDGNIVAALNGGTSGLVRVSAGGGAPTRVTEPSKEKGETAHIWPQVLPGSQAALFTAWGPGGSDDAEIDVVSFKTGERKTLHRGGTFARYLPSGHILYLEQNTLWAAPFDLDRLAVTGPAQPMIEEVNRNQLGLGDFGFSNSGTLVYVSTKGASLRYQIQWLDSTGRTTPLHMTHSMYENPRLSPDGKRLAFEIATGPARADIWVKDLERDTASRLTHLSGRNNHPVWTPDGRSIVFASYFQGDPAIYWIGANGAGEAQRLTDDRRVKYPSSFSPDGKTLAYYEAGFDGRSEIWTVPVEGDRDHPRLGKPEAFLRTTYREAVPAFSRDGRWLAYSSNESGTRELYVRPFPGPGGKSQVSTGGGSYPIWSHDGRRLFFLRERRIMVVRYSALGGTFAAEKPQAWSEKALAFMGWNYSYDLAPDDRRFAVVLDPSATEEADERPKERVTVLLNFFDELRRKLPPGKH
jgi:serine/threonine-protein kinase